MTNLDLPPPLPPLVNNTFFEDCIKKTAFVKSFPTIKKFIEELLPLTSINWHWQKKKWYKYIDVLKVFYNDLTTKIPADQQEKYQSLTKEEFVQLTKLNSKVPENATILFIPDQKKPVIAYNINKIPDFSSKGWVFHYRSVDGIKAISQTGKLQAPLERIVDKKAYLTKHTYKFNSDKRRLIDGISLAFQDYVKYQGFGGEQKPSGFFIFPIKTILRDSFILDFYATVDKYPEIVFIDRKYLTSEPGFVNKILSCIDEFKGLIKNSNRCKRFFIQTKRNLPFLHKLKEFETEFEKEHPTNCGIQFRKIGNKIYFVLKAPWTLPKDIYKKEIFIRESEFSGKGFFYEELCKTSLFASYLTKLIEFTEENKFFQFLLLTANSEIAYEKEEIIPALERYSDNQLSHYNNTIFQIADLVYKPLIERVSSKKKIKGLSRSLRQDTVSYRTLTPNMIILNFMKLNPEQHGKINEDSPEKYLAKLQTLNKKQINKLIKNTLHDVYKLLDVVIPKEFQTSEACEIKVNNGIICFPETFQNQAIIENFSKNGATIFTNMKSDENGTHRIDKRFLDMFFTEIVKLNNIDNGYELWIEDSYFFLENNHTMTNLRKSNKIIKID